MIQQTLLENGLLVLTNFNESALTTNISYTVNCGSYNEQEDNMGIAHFTEHMMFKGTTNRTSRQVSEDIEGIGGAMNACTSFNTTRYYCTVPSECWQTGIEVLSDMIWNNTIPEEEFNKEKQVILEELKMYEDDPSSKVWELLFMSMTNNFNRQLIGGTLETVSAITCEQMLDFINKYYIPSNMIVVATGNIDHEKLVAYLNDICPDLPNVDLPPVPPLEKTSNDNSPEVVRNDIAQSHLCWGIYGDAPQNYEEYVTAKLTACILGGNSSSRLYQLIREERGLAYTVQMFVEMMQDNIILCGYTGLDKQQIDSVKEVVKNELKKLTTELVDEKELTRAKNYLKGSIKRNLESTENQNDFISEHQMFSLPLELEQYLNTIDQITSEDIKGYTSKYFTENNLYFSQVISK